MRRISLNLSVLLRANNATTAGGPKWTAICLEYAIVGDAESPRGALADLAENFADIIQEQLEVQGVPMEDLLKSVHPAPAEVIEAFNEALPVEMSFWFPIPSYLMVHACAETIGLQNA